MKEPMCNYVIKVPGSSNYQFRRKIPQELISHYNKKEIKKSLRTSDRREAERLSRIEASKLDVEWESIRQSLLPTNNLKPAVGKVISSDNQGSESTRAKYIGDDIWNREAKQVTAAVTASFPVRDVQDVETASYRVLLQVRALSRLAVTHGLLEEYLANVRLIVAEREERLNTGNTSLFGSESYEALDVSEAMRNGHLAFLNGTGPTVWFNPAQLKTDSANYKTANAEAAVSLIALVDKWEGEGKRNQKTVDMYNRTVTRFRDLVGTMCIQDIKRLDVVRFKDELMKSSQTAVNTNKQLVVVNTLLNYAKANALIDTNPASGVSIKVVKQEKPRVAFDAQALNAIFSSPVYSDNQRPKAGAGEAAYWLPLLALFTGARIEELGQLHPTDVMEETYYDEEGNAETAWVIRIRHSEEAGQGVKNFGSNRRVPIHSELVRLGFLSYALAAQAEGRYRIFDKLVADKYGTETAQFSKWFGRYLRMTCGVVDKRMTFHSFRHAFKDFCRLAGIDVGDRLTGHVTGAVGDSYGADFYPLHPLVNAIKRFRVLGVDISKLEPVT